MAFVENQGVNIYWNEEGAGPPVLLIMGLGYNSAAWWRTRPVLAARYRTIALDNRGVGRSGVPPGPYSIEWMASDAAAALAAAGAPRAHVFGISMGGMIAQEFALRHPEKVSSLILGCTAPGGPNAVRAERQAIDMLTNRANLSLEAAAEAAIPFIYDPDTPRVRIEEDLERRRPWLPTPQGYLAQLQAIFAWESYSRLPEIKAPTLVIHGQNDRLIPPGNGELLASRIPGAQLTLIPHAGHLFTTDQPEAASRAILEFLDAQ
ncbi:MAG TPA: alpha/beta fold hydrolase [Bryobacteraceae bacterium]|nr:alpha/beta fold hydrolase [Bryobacteraceae bacterium]